MPQNYSFNNMDIHNLEEYRSIHWDDLEAKHITFLIKNGVCNGCGGAGNKIHQRLIRWFLGFLLSKLRAVFVEASCNIHDFTYWQGGDNKRRKECDQWFFYTILNDIQKYIKDPWLFSGYVILALVFYTSVRLLGWAYFNFSPLKTNENNSI